MLRPQDTTTRERKNLNGLWRFALDADSKGTAAAWFAGPLPEASEMAVPASFNDIAADAAVRDYFGDVWYQRTVWVTRGWQGQRIVLNFESATHRATVWINEIEVVSHEGGYTPFEVDITDQATPGEQIRITARVNNTLHWQSIPPGVIEDTPAGPRQRYWHDFFNYAGIHRSVWLYATPPAYIADLTVTMTHRSRTRCARLRGTLTVRLTQDRVDEVLVGAEPCGRTGGLRQPAPDGKGWSPTTPG